MAEFYPPIEPFERGFLAVDPPHQLYYEQSGNPNGKPVIFLHGGPGGGTDPEHRRFFDPAVYRIVLLDQRACGRSTPLAELAGNDTWSLVEDLERLRKHLGIERWQVFGGSWGSTLALAYAQTYPKHVTELVLRGIFTFTRREIDWFYAGGTGRLFPDAWEDFLAPIPMAERADLIQAYYQRLTGNDEQAKRIAARAWSLYECRVATLRMDPEVETHCDNPDFTLPFARIEAHYFVNGGFLSHETQLLEGVASIRHLPCTIVHGRYDVICPLENAFELHRLWPESKLVIVGDAGHSAFEPGIISALVDATNSYR